VEGYLHEFDTLDSRQFAIAVKRLADSLSYGADRSPFLGSGIEYVQSRQYQFGDPIRSIDWRITARTRKLHVKEYEAPKRLPAYLLIDTSASMAISSLPLSKYHMALQIAGGLAFACLDRISPVGVLGVGGRDMRVEPSLSKHQIMQWLHRLRRFRLDESTSLSRRVSELGPRLKENALIVTLSDLHDPDAISSLKLMAQKHDVVMLQMRDPAEDGLRGAGVFRAREAETGRRFVTHGRSRWLDQETVDDELKQGGIDHLLLQTDRPVAQRLRQFFASRDLLGRGAR
jgi:uncharacterized protein (DUF58 family)